VRVMIIGSLGGPLGKAAEIALARGAALDHTASVSEALTALRVNSKTGLILCDIGLPIGELLASLASERMPIPVVACGADATADDAVRAIKAGARDFLPLPPDALLIAALLQDVSRERHHLVAHDPAMLATIRRAEQVAHTDASILLTGASGTGKEVLARYIHQNSKRAARDFVAINCAAIPEALLESELFGHEKGAFSGAVGRRIGKFESADGGTLLLDEISEMDVRLQAKLLRALQEREIDRVGGGKPVRVDVRILATSNRDLQREIDRGTFRADLFFRLNVVNLRLPSLAERRGDIVKLAEHFAEHFAQLNGVPARPLSNAFRHRLVQHAWPGNVRELENTIHRAVLLATGPEVDEDALELPNTMPAQSQPQGTGGAPAPPSSIDHLVGQRIEDVERDLILQTLARTNGNRTHAAVMLGISIRALRNKLKDYSLRGVPVPPPSIGVAA